MRPLGVTLVGFYQILRGALSLVFGFRPALHRMAAKLAFSPRRQRRRTAPRDFGHIAALASLSSLSYTCCRLRRPANAKLGRLLTLLFRHGLVLVLPASSTATCFRCSSEPSTRPASSIWPCPGQARLPCEGNPMRMAA